MDEVVEKLWLNLSKKAKQIIDNAYNEALRLILRIALMLWFFW